jgi:hypothetical protein
VVTIDAKGQAKRLLPSGAVDRSPLAGTVRLDERVREQLARRLTDAAPLTLNDIGFARPTLESVDAFNRARADWRRAIFVLREELGRNDRDLGEIALEAMKDGEGLEPEDFVDEAGATLRLEVLVAAVNDAAEKLGRAIDALAEAAW